MVEGELMSLKIKVLGNASQIGLPPVEARPGYVFTLDPSCDDYDWLVVFDELPLDDRGTCRGGCEPLACPPENTILCTWEPVSIKSYSKAYTRQFCHLLTNRPPEAEGHPGYHLGRGYFPWCNGHALGEFRISPRKAKTISAVCSAKRMRHSKHFARFRLVSEMAKAIPEMDWFGYGVRPLAKKYEALDAYKYHVAVENHIGVHHWTEKFADAILSECLPFYAGDPAVGEIFPKESYIPIPIDDPAEAIRIVRAAIMADEYAKRREAVLEAKRLILEKYNFADQVIGVIRESGDASCPTRRDAVSAGGFVYSRRTLRWHSPSAAIEDLLWHLRRMK